MCAFSTMRIVSGIYVVKRGRSSRFPSILRKMVTGIEEGWVSGSSFQFTLRVVFFSLIAVSSNGVLVLVGGTNFPLLILADLLLVLLLVFVWSTFSRKIDKKLSFLALRN